MNLTVSKYLGDIMKVKFPVNNLNLQNGQIKLTQWTRISRRGWTSPIKMVLSVNTSKMLLLLLSLISNII